MPKTSNPGGFVRRSKGSPLVHLDIRNSQPLNFSIPLGDFCRRRGAMPEDVVRYVELVQEGRLYDHLMAHGGIPEDRRAAFKRRFFGQVFFCPNFPETAGARLFGQLFPNVYAAIREMKDVSVIRTPS